MPRSGGVEAGSDAIEESAPGPFTMPVFDDGRIGSDQIQPNFRKAEAEIEFGAGPFEKVTLVVDLSSTCYPFDDWKNDLGATTATRCARSLIKPAPAVVSTTARRIRAAPSPA
jgi:hypothetical protein